MQPSSSIRSTAFAALLAFGVVVGSAHAEEGKAAVFKIDLEAETASVLDTDDTISEKSELRVYAAGPKGSTVVIGAFGEEGLHDDLLPIAVAQTGASEAARFPAVGESKKETLKTGGKNAELYVVVFPDAHPALELIVTELEQIKAAHTKGEKDLVMLLSLELKKKLADAIRESSAKEYSEGFSDSLADLLKEEPTAKAAVTRTGTKLDDLTADVDEAKPTSKSLEELEKSWRDDSISLPVGLVAPGGFVRSITPTP